MTLFILGLILFLANHMVRVVAPGFRQGLVDRLGLTAWRGIYSVVSLVSIALLVYGFGEARATTGMLYYPPTYLSHVALTLMLIATIVFTASLLPPGHIRTKAKHPMVLSVKIWALAHLLSNGETVSVVLFAAFLAWGVVLRISLKRRERAGEVALPVFESAKWDILAVAVGLVVYAGIVFGLHEWLIGVAPIVKG